MLVAFDPNDRAQIDPSLREDIEPAQGVGERPADGVVVAERPDDLAVPDHSGGGVLVGAAATKFLK